MSTITEDWLLNERVRIFQPEIGYRAGLDAILLAASIRASEKEHILDLGCGAGGALFTAAWRLPGTRFTGVDRDKDILDCTQQGLRANEFEDRMTIETLDAARMPASFENRFDQVMSNPPYFEPGRISAPGPGRAGAYMAELPLNDWLKAMLFAVKPKGRITLIHRAGMLGDILAYLMSRSGQIEILPVRSAPGDAAKRVLVTARKGLRRGETILHEGLTTHQARGGAAYTAVAERVLRGEALDWA